MNTFTIRVTNEFKQFDYNIKKNIIKAGGEDTTSVDRTNLIVKFFKNNNDVYLRLIQMGVEIK